MADNFVSVKITGLDEIQRRLEKELPEKMKKQLRAALKDGAKVVKDQMVADAPYETGILEENIGVRVSVKSGEVAGAAYIGPSGKAKYPERISKGWFGQTIKKRSEMPVATIARFQEYGFHDRAGNPVAGSMFMSRAFQRQKGNALEKIIAALKQAVGMD